MATVTYSAIDNIMQDIVSSIPGPQEGESIFDFRARVNQRLVEIVDVVADHKRRVERFVRDHSDECWTRQTSSTTRSASASSQTSSRSDDLSAEMTLIVPSSRA